MKPSLTGSLAVAALASQAFAGGETASEWLGLDKELHALSSNISLDNHEGANFGALLRTSLISSDDFGSGNDEDTLGWLVNDARIWGEGNLGESFRWRISVNGFDQFGLTSEQQTIEIDDQGDSDPTNDTAIPVLAATPFGLGASSSGVLLEDAFASLALNDNLSLTMGRFVAPSFQSANTRQDGLLFINRTVLGSFGYQWSEGVMLGGDYDDGLAWWVAAMNGTDGIADELDLRGRIEYSTGGRVSGYNKANEGALGAGEDLAATIGLTYADDGGFGDDSTWFALDVSATVAGFYLHAEAGDFDDTAPGFAGSTPFAVTASYAIPDSDFEVAARFEDLDNDVTVTTIGANMYMEGHNGKWQL
ncbi:MAG: hypothetical protein ACYS26_20205, partial [Planctomycetota bacterium]